MIGLFIRLRFTMPRMESLPESSKPFGDLVKADRELPTINQQVDQLVD